MTNLVARLRALSKGEHDDLSVAREAADELESLQTERSDLIREQCRLAEMIDSREKALAFVVPALAEPGEQP